MANHHDNFDNFDSAHHGWNSVRVGPKRDIVGTWAKAARKAGLRFGCRNHFAHAWHWWQTAYGYDAEGPRAARATTPSGSARRDGSGTWWDGLDPQELYTGPTSCPPDGIDSITAMNAWHETHDGQWHEDAAAAEPALRRATGCSRQKDLVDKYRPDLVYFDDTGLPFGQPGLEAAAHYYNAEHRLARQARRRDDREETDAAAARGVVEDVERGFVDDIRPEPWQTDTCIGNWHYDRGLYDKRYKSAKQVVQRLCDIVSKNGNLLLSIPVRGNGTIDDEEEGSSPISRAGSRPMARRSTARGRGATFGEGPTRPKAGFMNEGAQAPFTSADVRFTAKAACCTRPCSTGRKARRGSRP